MKIPDNISPVVAYRVWRWKATGLQSLNGEPWLPGQHLEARCRVAPAARDMAEAANEVPHRKCTCGIYAAKNSEHLRQIGYADGGVCGEVYLWGAVVEHKLGWRAQFAYPKSLGLPLSLLPFTLAELNARLLALTAFGIDIVVLHNGESMRLWKNGQGYDTNGLDYIINLRREHYLRQQQERSLNKGDRVALPGRGIAIVKEANDKEAVVILGRGHAMRIAREHIVLNQHNRRWEMSPGLLA
jgi:preprotein translocase subunit YajC